MEITKKTGSTPCFQNRELSWIMFNRRVLEQANCDNMPLLERLKFISIFTTNLDEFYMVRVGSLIDSIQFSPKARENKTGLTAQEQLDEINKHVLPLYEMRSRYFSSIMSSLAKYGLQHHNIETLDKFNQNKLKFYFVNFVMPLLSPQIIDNRHPFPYIADKHLHIAVSLVKKNKLIYGIIPVPQNMDRIILLEGKSIQYILLEELIYHFADMVFELFSIVERTIFAITRNADINTEEDFLDEDIDYRKHMSKIIQERRRMAPVRLELQYNISETFKNFLCDKLILRTSHIYETQAPLDYTYVFKLRNKLDAYYKKKLTWSSFTPIEKHVYDKKASVMKHIQRKDLLLHFPYESMSPFLTLIHQAAEDSSVVSIKITLYRLARHSKLAEYLSLAAENGKEVVVLMELRARFDELNNIEWAQRLEEAGCRVIYGPPRYKTHSKICLITKKEFGRISYITQIGTGNYNETTAKLYTDLCLITANQAIGKDAVNFFNNLLLGNLDGEYTHLWVSPHALKYRFMCSVDKEIEKAKNGDEGCILIKCNSLTDKEIIEKLIKASQSGVKITLIVRGICCLIPKVTGYTDNISVISIVGRFLEHSRIFCFGSGLQMEVFISSADLMTRNTEHRVEVACPIYDLGLKARIATMFEYLIADNTKAWEQSSDGNYQQRQPLQQPEINTQELFMTPEWNAGIIATEYSNKKVLTKFRKLVLKVKNGLRIRKKNI